MTKVISFEDTDFPRVKRQVEDFLNNAKCIQIMDITWLKTMFWVCIITYFDHE